MLEYCGKFAIYGCLELVFVLNYYRHWPLLALRNGNGLASIFYSREGVTQETHFILSPMVLAFSFWSKTWNRRILKSLIPGMLKMRLHYVCLETSSFISIHQNIPARVVGFTPNPPRAFSLCVRIILNPENGLTYVKSLRFVLARFTLAVLSEKMNPNGISCRIVQQRGKRAFAWSAKQQWNIPEKLRRGGPINLIEVNFLQRVTKT